MEPKTALKTCFVGFNLKTIFFTFLVPKNSNFSKMDEIFEEGPNSPQMTPGSERIQKYSPY